MRHYSILNDDACDTSSPHRSKSTQLIGIVIDAGERIGFRPGVVAKISVPLQDPVKALVSM